MLLQGSIPVFPVSHFQVYYFPTTCSISGLLLNQQQPEKSQDKILPTLFTHEKHCKAQHSKFPNSNVLSNTNSSYLLVFVVACPHCHSGWAAKATEFNVTHSSLHLTKWELWSTLILPGSLVLRYGGTAREEKSQKQSNPHFGKSLRSYLRTLLSWPVFANRFISILFPCHINRCINYQSNTCYKVLPTRNQICSCAA